MKIGYLDVHVNKSEDYSLNPRRYGGGAVVARYAKEIINGTYWPGQLRPLSHDLFTIFASKDCFDNLTDKDNKAACVPIDDWKLESLKAGAPVAAHIPNAASYDLFLHHHDCMTFNMAGLKAPLVHWALMGDGRANHPATPYSLLYKQNDRAVHGKTLYIQLGKPIPAYKATPKEDLLFQCTRHDPHMNSIEVAKQCIEHKLKCYFAGPIASDYPLMTYIDNIHTFYLGAIDEVTKLDYLSRARLVPLLFQWDSPFNQSAIEALAMDTPLVINPRGFLKDLVKDNENGLVYQGSLKEAMNRVTGIKPGACHASVERYNELNMIDSFKTALKIVLSDWKATHP